MPTNFFLRIARRTHALLSTRHLAATMGCFVAASSVFVATEDASAQTLKKLTSPAINERELSALRMMAPRTKANAPLSDTFLLHSRPSATKKVYLDFDGHVTTGTGWNSSSVPKITTAIFSTEGDESFSDNEKLQIQEIWERVSECYSPFDVDVTTEPPPVEDLMNTGGNDVRWGIRVLIGVSSPDPAPSAGGVAFLTSFRWDSDTPTFVFPQRLGNSPKAISDATVHEVGHTLGLDHDGRITPSEGYYSGHGSGPTGWAPQMGVGYSKQLVQWSKGEYLSANNTEDDLQIITTTNGFGYRPDDFSNTQGAASSIAGTTNAGVLNFDQRGVIERSTDADWFKITAGSGTLALYAVGGPSNTMLDINMELYNSAGALVTSSNPTDDVIATINRTVSAGTYFVKIEGVGNGDPLATGYTDYSSLGQYRITGNCPSTDVPGNVVALFTASTNTLTLTGDTKKNSVQVKSEAGQLKITGLNGTRINNKTTVVSFPLPKAGLKVYSTLSDGDDSIYLIGVAADVVGLKLGNGADNAGLALCAVKTLEVDGGLGTDAVVTTTSTITTTVMKNVP